MNRAGIAVIAGLTAALFLCYVHLLESKAKVKEQEEEIKQISEFHREVQLELEDKIQYIDTLNESVENLNADIVTLEQKLHELSIASDKLD